MTAPDLRGRRALVTGAGKRVGRAIAVALGRAGMSVAVHHHESRDGAEETRRLVTEAGGTALVVTADLRDRDETRGLVDDAVAGLGGLDLLVANAAGYERLPLGAVDDAAWDRMLALNLTSPFVLATRAAPHLDKTHGSIVFITCASATAPFKNHLPYVVSKGGLRHLMQTLALELAPGVRVNAVSPGTVLPPEGASPDFVARLESRIPLGHVGTPEDVADAVVYLARAPFVTGHEIQVDGGRTLA